MEPGYGKRESPAHTGCIPSGKEDKLCDPKAAFKMTERSDQAGRVFKKMLSGGRRICGKLPRKYLNAREYRVEKTYSKERILAEGRVT